MKKIALRFFSIFASVMVALTVNAAGTDLTATKSAQPAGSVATQKLTPKSATSFKMAEMRKPGKTYNAFASVNNSKLGLAKLAAKKNATVKAGNVPTFNAAMIYNAAWPAQDYSQAGIYNLAVDGSMIQPYYLNEGLQPNAGYFYNGKYYAMSMFSSWGMYFVDITVFDEETWEVVAASGTQMDPSLFCTDYAFDETTGKAYGCFYNSEATGYIFGYSDPETFETTAICALVDDSFNACAFGADGYIYAIGRTGNLLKVDKTTGAYEIIGNTGLEPHYITTAYFDKKTGRYFYLLNNDSESSIYEINLATAEATPLYSFANGEEFTGAYVAAAKAEDKAPAEVENVVADFNEDSLRGTVSFTTPTTLFDGTEGSGTLAYFITVDGVTVHTAFAGWGENVSVPVAIGKSGMHEIIVYVKNGAGESPKSKVKMFIGTDMVKPVTNVALTYAEGAMNLTWDPTNTSLNGGWFDPATIRYTVVRFPEGVVVADQIAETTFTEEFVTDEFQAVYYTVQASNTKELGEAVASNAIGVGSIYPAYTNGFENELSLAGYTQINKNEDGNTWELYNGEVRFKYNSSLAMDAWLITPAVKLEAGKMYKISVDARANSSNWAERFELCVGTEPTAEAMTENVVEKTELTSTTAETFGDYFIPKTTGTYYVGIHGCSDADAYYIYFDNLTIEAGLSTAAPTAVTKLKVANDPTGATNATVSFTAPKKTIAGDKLTALEKIEVKRGDVLVKTFEAPELGAALSFVDQVEADGEYTYTVTAFNEEGAGMPRSASAYIGIDVPAAVTDAAFTEDPANVGLVTITWTAPTTDIHGTPIDPATVSYYITNYDGDMVAEAITGTSATIQLELEAQTFEYFRIFSANDKGINEKTYGVTSMEPVGEPYAAPFTEPFGEELSTLWGVNQLAGELGAISWTLLNDESGVESQNGDNGMLACKGSAPGDMSMLLSGKIDLAGVETPAFKFWYFTMEGSENTFDVLVKEQGGEWTTLKSFTTGGDMKWVMGLVDLSAYKDKVVQVGIKVTVVNMVYTIFDNFFVGTPASYDLAVDEIAAPAKVKAGDDFNVSVKLVNLGIEDANGFKVNLYRDGALVQTAAPDAVVTSGAAEVVTFVEKSTPLWNEAVVYTAVIDWEADEDDDNDVSADINVAIKHTTVPVPTDLTATADGEKVNLAWTAPVVPEGGTPTEVTEGFEEYDSFAINPESDWTFVDADGSKTYGMNGVEFPGASEPMAYIVMDATFEGFNDTFAAFNGDKYLGSFAATTPANDDWAISPELSGDAQTISFYARTYTDQYGSEEFEFLYSTTGTATSNFISLGEVHDVPTEWTEYTYNLPEGAKYFAIRCISNDKFIFMVDEVTFTKVDAAPVLAGYNIYRDGVKINAELVTETSFVDETAEVGEHTYHVTAVYDKGESNASNAASTVTTGVENVAVKGARVATGKNVIIVKSAADMMVTVAAADGRLVYAGKGAETMNISVAEGVYVVKVGEKVVKVIVQ